MLKRFRVEQGSDNDVVRVPMDVMRRATEAIFRICGMTVSTTRNCMLFYNIIIWNLFVLFNHYLHQNILK